MAFYFSVIRESGLFTVNREMAYFFFREMGNGIFFPRDLGYGKIITSKQTIDVEYIDSHIMINLNKVRNLGFY